MRQRFRVVAKDSYINDGICRMTYPADSEEQLRKLLEENAPNLTIVRIETLERGLSLELHEARKNVRILPEASELFALADKVREKRDGERAERGEQLDQEDREAFERETQRQLAQAYHERESGWARRTLIEEGLKSCCALAEILGVEAQENLARVLQRFDQHNTGCSHALKGLASDPFSFSFSWGGGLYGEMIFHRSMKQWSTNT